MTFLSREEVVRLHAMVIDLYGGGHGLGDEGMLRSAIAQAEASFDGAYLHEDVPGMAAAYGFHLAQNHPFVDGNKRVALAAMLVFLEVNGRPLRVSQEEMYAVMMSVASSRMSKEALTRWLGDRLG